MGTGAQLFLLGFLKILALLLAFFLLDKERRDPRPRKTARHGITRWLQWPIVVSLAVACSAEGYDAYLTYTDATESADRTQQLLSSIERRSRPLFPLQIYGSYLLDATGTQFQPLAEGKSLFVDGDGSVNTDTLKTVAAKVLAPQWAQLFDTDIDATMFFIKDAKGTYSLQDFLSDPSENRIELSVRFQGPRTSCPSWEGGLTMNCEWHDALLKLPINTPPVDRFSQETYIHGGIQFFPDLVQSVLIVRSCLRLADNLPQPDIVKDLKKRLRLNSLTLSVAGGDSFSFTKPITELANGGCDYSMFRFGRTPEELEMQVEGQ